MSKADFLWERYANRGIKPWSHDMPVHPRLTDEAGEYLVANVREVAGARPEKP